MRKLIPSIGIVVIGAMLLVASGSALAGWTNTAGVITDASNVNITQSGGIVKSQYRAMVRDVGEKSFWVHNYATLFNACAADDGNPSVAANLNTLTPLIAPYLAGRSSTGDGWYIDKSQVIRMVDGDNHRIFNTAGVVTNPNDAALIALAPDIQSAIAAAQPYVALCYP